MARISGVDVPDDKKLEYALRYIYGIGPTRAQEIVRKSQLDPERADARAGGFRGRAASRDPLIGITWWRVTCAGPCARTSSG